MPKLNVFFRLFARQIAQKQPETFGQQRAEQLNQRLDKALADRRKLFRAEFAAQAPLKTTYALRGGLADHKIDHFKAKIEEAKK